MLGGYRIYILLQKLKSHETLLNFSSTSLNRSNSEYLSHRAVQWIKWVNTRKEFRTVHGTQ